MKKRTKLVCVVFIAPLMVFAAVNYLHRREATDPATEADTLLLLLPDSVDSNTTAVREWIDAADEEGLHLRPVHDSEFLGPLSTTHARGVIIP
ncbi:MAG: hypothetical protein ACRD4E_06055, partial [Bryobacteraceae bacterium]